MNSSACRCWLQNKSTLSEKKDDFHLKLLQFYTQKNNFLLKSQKLNVHTSRWFHVALVLVLPRNGRGERRLTSPLGGRWWLHRQGSRVAHASLWWNISSLLQMALAGRLSFSGEVQVFDWRPAWADIKKKTAVLRQGYKMPLLPNGAAGGNFRVFIPFHFHFTVLHFSLPL